MLPPLIKTSRYTLKPYRKNDIERFVEMALDPISVQFMGGANGIEAEERELFGKIFELYTKQAKRWFWIWGIYQNDRLCGHMEMKETEHTNESQLEIVYMVHPEERKKGLISEVLQKFKELQSEWGKEIIATVDVDNIHSISVLEKWGIKKQELVKPEDDDSPFYKVYLSN